MLLKDHSNPEDSQKKRDLVKCRISLTVTNTKLPSHMISEILDMEPTIVSEVGTVIFNDVVSRSTIWTHSEYPAPGMLCIEEALKALAQELSSKRGAIKQLRKHKAKFKVSIIVDSWDHFVHVNIPSTTLALLGQLGVELQMMSIVHDDDERLFYDWHGEDEEESECSWIPSSPRIKTWV